MSLPPEGIDVHAHVLDPARPALAGAAYTPEPRMTLAGYEAHLVALGLRRGVLVGASAYGTDNSLLVDALGHRDLDLRGVAVVDPAIDDAELDRLFLAGVRGVRCQDLIAGGTPLSALEFLAPRVAERGGHVEIWTHVHPELADRVRALGTPVVLDHLGHPLDPAGVEAMIDLARDGLAWITVSGAYRLRPRLTPAAAAEAVRPLVERLVDAVPDRLLWGSDWPFVAFDPAHAPSPAELVDDAVRWFPDEALRRQVLWVNPARCYGFGWPS